MKKTMWIYKKGKFIQSTKWDRFWRKLYNLKKRFRIVDSWKYRIIPASDSKYYFKMSDKEYEESQKLYKEKGTISYEFYPCGGIGWGVKIHCLDNDEIIDITDISKW